MSRTDIHIVSHVYSKRYKQYAVFLRAQLSSLVLYQPCINAKITVVCTQDDPDTWDVLREFERILDKDRLDVLVLKPGELFRRAIGRNKVALESKAGIIWFTDCDHFFGRGCLDDLWNVWKEFESPPAMVWPRTVLVHNGYQIADEFYQQYKTAFGSLIIDLNDDLFVPRKYRKAIGGVQIVRGDFANKHGYLNGQEKWMRPMPEDRPFPCFRDDAKYRNYCQHHDRIEGIDFCGLYRLRHSCVTYRGKPRGAIDEEI